MARRKTAGEMTAGEQIGGTVFFTVYLLVLPFAAGPLFDLAAGLLGVTLSAADVDKLVADGDLTR